MKLEFLMLAQNYNPAKHKVGGWFCSEKFDGSRCFWDGGITRNMNIEDIPWANIIKDKHATFATGLWSRSGKIIYAPDWWTDSLPSCFLDGELFISRGNFQSLRKIVAKHEPTKEWEQVKFKVFDSPTLSAFSVDREIKVRSQYNYKIERVYNFCKGRNFPTVPDYWIYEHVYSWLADKCTGVAELIGQEKLPVDEYRATVRLKEKMQEVVEAGGEGVVLRDPMSKWQPLRSHNLLKMKPVNDAEGTLVGFTSGRETNKGSKLRGKIGALILDVNGIRLELSGLTDEERELFVEDSAYAYDHPGEDLPTGIQAKHFNLGDLITFKYREKTDEGNYKEARYLRKRI